MPQSIIGTINQWEQSNLEIFPPSRIYNVLIGTNLNTSGYKFIVVGDTKLEGNVEITGNLSAVIQTLKVIEKTDDVDYLITFITATGDQIPFYANGQIKYNPFTNKLTVGNITSDLTTSTGYLSSNLEGLIQNNQLQNDSITIDSILLELGSSYSQLSLDLVNSTGYLTSNLDGLVQNNQIQNSSITIGTRLINLGDIITSISGMSSITSTNFYGLIDKIVVNNSVYNGDLKIVFSDGSNNLLDNAGLLYQPNNRILKVESNNSQTYQLLLKNSGQSAGIQIKGAPAVTQYEANITHYLDVLKIQNTGSDTEIEQVGIGTIRLFNLNGSLTLNSSGNIIASGIYAGNGSLLTSLTTANLNGLIQNNQLQNDTITIGSTTFNLGDTLTALSGLTSVTSDLFDGKLYIEERTDSKNYSLLFSVIPLGVDNERLINTDTNIYWNPFLSTLTCYRLDGYATGLELQTFSNIKPFVFCDGGIVTTQSVYTTSSNDLCWDNNNKRLGIGTSTPLSLLDLGTSVSSQKLALYNNNWNTGGGAGFYGFGTGASRMDFHANTAQGGTPQMVLNSSGNVGIGLTNPSSKLHVSSADGYIQKWDSTSSNSFLYHDSTSTEIGTNSATDLILSAYAQKMILKQGTGYVGIGTTNPNTTLDVNGDMNISGVITQNSPNGIGSGTFTATPNIKMGSCYMVGLTNITQQWERLMSYTKIGNIININGGYVFRYSGSGTATTYISLTDIGLPTGIDTNVYVISNDGTYFTNTISTDTINNRLILTIGGLGATGIYYTSFKMLMGCGYRYSY